MAVVSVLGRVSTREQVREESPPSVPARSTRLVGGSFRDPIGSSNCNDECESTSLKLEKSCDLLGLPSLHSWRDVCHYILVIVLALKSKHGG